MLCFCLGFVAVQAVQASSADSSPVINVAPVLLQTGEFDEQGLSRLKLFCSVDLPAQWHVAWTEPVRLTMTDSEGGKSPSVMWIFLDKDAMGSGRGTFFKKGLHIHGADGWLPGDTAKWIRVKGSIPFIVAARDAVLEPLKLKLAPGAVIPVVLKGAGVADGSAGERDVAVSVKVESCEASGARENEVALHVSLLCNSRVDLRKLEFRTEGGRVLETHDSYWSNSVSDSKYCYAFWCKMPRVQDDAIHIVVHYAAGLRRVMVPVDIRTGLFGFTVSPAMKQDEANQQ